MCTLIKVQSTKLFGAKWALKVGHARNCSNDLSSTIISHSVGF